jgi:hypothetical protein
MITMDTTWPASHTFWRDKRMIVIGPSAGSGQALRQAQDRPFGRLRTGLMMGGAAHARGMAEKLLAIGTVCVWPYPSTRLRTRPTPMPFHQDDL